MFVLSFITRPRKIDWADLKKYLNGCQKVYQCQQTTCKVCIFNAGILISELVIFIQ